MFRIIQVCLVILAIGLIIAQEQELCSEGNSCYCKLQDGKVINLEPLGNANGTMRFTDISKVINGMSYKISYNPCYPASIQTEKDVKNQECKNVAACLVNQTDALKKEQYQVAVHSNAKYLTDSKVNWILYSEFAGFQERDVFVELNCEKDAKKPPTLELIDVQQIGNQLTYVRMNLTSICACPDGCPMVPKKTSKGLSFGSILLILLAVVVLMYLLGGMIYNHRAKNATGCGLLPNIEFWTAFPGLVMDGLRYTCNCCRTRRYGAAYDEA